MKPSTSYDRFSNQILRYSEEAKSGNQDALDWLDYYLEARRKETELEQPSTPCLEYALRTSQKLCEKVRMNEVYAQHLYAALCNNVYESQGVRWHTSWRRCGAIVAHMRERGDYIDWYCTGIFADDSEADQLGYLSEGEISPEIAADLEELGWTVYNESTTTQE